MESPEDGEWEKVTSQAYKGQVVAVFAEDSQAAVGGVEDVVDLAAEDAAGSSGHGLGSLASARGGTKESPD